MGRRSRPLEDGEDLFSAGSPVLRLDLKLARKSWPDQGRFPVNHGAAKVRQLVWSDLTTSRHPLVVAGWASIEQIVQLAAAARSKPDHGTIRVLLGSEPFTSKRAFGSSARLFTEEARSYWNAEGISVLASGKVLHAIEAIRDGWLQPRFIDGATRLHAKIYVGDDAVTVGSSNFTQAGMSRQFEANVRFTRAGDRKDFGANRIIAENFWEVGTDWSQEMLALLESMTKVVPWEEALARACASLLEGQWADLDLGAVPGANLWPHQMTGIAQAMWVIENVGSVLVADPTGSGKTRMGAHLVRAVRDRLLSTGQIRDGFCTMVCPGPVKPAWEREAVECLLPLHIVSDGLLSRSARERRLEEDQVERAQVLAIDEAHRFLNPKSRRSLQIGASAADNVVMFTATPINREVRDLLAHVDLLGADNFPDDLLELLGRLQRKRGVALTAEERGYVSAELQRFIVRRTKAQLNQVADEAPEAYLDEVSGRVNRYPAIAPRVYETGESDDDQRIATQIRELAKQLRGVTDLAGRHITRHEHLGQRDDAEVLTWRLRSVVGLTQYRLLSSMRSSRAALLEHLIGTDAAYREVGLDASAARKSETGDVISKIREAKTLGRPSIELDCALPEWLTDDRGWAGACDLELKLHEEVLALARELGIGREQSKADALRRLARKHERVLAFEHKPISAAHVRLLLDSIDETEVLLAMSTSSKDRKRVERLFRPDATGRVLAICTDAMNEGLNLQGASALAHLDYPTTLRAAEQRVGRIVRMNSHHDDIETWWPKDTPAFKLRKVELLHARHKESSQLIGGNLDLPVEMTGEGDVEDIVEHDPTLPDTMVWEGIDSALEPVRLLVAGNTAIVPASVYAAYRHSRDAVRSQVSVVPSRSPWAFLAIEAPGTGAPRWMLIDATDGSPYSQIELVAERLRALLAERPESSQLSEDWEVHLEHFLHVALRQERKLLPRRLQRALEQMNSTCLHWAEEARRVFDYESADRWNEIARLTTVDRDQEPSEGAADLYQVGTIWLRLVKPLRDAAKATKAVRARRYSLIADISPVLRAQPLPIDQVEEALSVVSEARAIDKRITACILGIPS